MTDSQNKNSAAVILQEKKSHVRYADQFLTLYIKSMTKYRELITVIYTVPPKKSPVYRYNCDKPSP